MVASQTVQDRVWSALPSRLRSAAKSVYSTAGRVAPQRRALPDFIIVGAQRSGTTSLYNCLAEHPDVARALTKEVRFFDVQYDRGIDWYRSNFVSTAARRRHQNATGRRLVLGEASPDYLFYPLVPGRLARDLPEAQLLVVLRNPVDRAFSHYWHQVTRGHESLTFEEAVRTEPARISDRSTGVSYATHHFSYLTRGHYAEQLEHLFAYVPRDQVLVEFSDELFTTPAVVLDRICDFLGLERMALDALPELNGFSQGEMGADLRARLERYFAPHDRALEDLLGRALPWRADG